MISPRVVRSAAALEPPDHVRELVQTLEAAGFEAWCVGGAVRDALLGLQHLDWDLATSATPGEMRKVFRRTIPIGEEFGTLGVLDRAGRMHEVTTFRHDVKTDGRHAVVEFGASLDEDLARRDFTINAIAFSPTTGEIRDPFGGMHDLERGIVRAVGEARVRFREDRLRTLRALRFAGRFDFSIDPDTWRAVQESANFLTRLSPERIQQELVKTLQQVERPSSTLGLWKQAGAFAQLIPTLNGQPQWVWRAPDCIARPDGTTSAPRGERLTQLRLATLFSGVPEEATQRVLRALRFSKRAISRVAHLAHIASGISSELIAQGHGTSDAGITARRWAARAGRVDLADALRVAVALHAAQQDVLHPTPDTYRAHMLRTYRYAVRIAWRDPVEIADLVVDGEDLLAAGVPGGRILGDLLRQLMEWVIVDPSRNKREALLERAMLLLKTP